jgi:hypothetical protein
MANVNQIYGRIGAAKVFSSNVSNALSLRGRDMSDEISKLEAELNSTTDEKTRQRLKKKIRRLKSTNKLNSINQKAAKGVTDFLTKIAQFMDISIRELIEWIAQVIVVVLPALEVSVKMLLLSNIKKMVSCSVDPRIPDYWRTEGVILNEAQIDPRQILKTGPHSKWGKYNYFGCYYHKGYNEGDEKPVSSFARADDMNAFLWYARNACKFVSANVINPNQMDEYFDSSVGENFYNHHYFKGKQNHVFTNGSSFKNYEEAPITFLCEECEIVGDDRYYTIVPATDTWTGVTWYKDRTSLTGTERNKKIDYDKSKPLFNIEHLGTYGEGSLFMNGNFRFRILPKPYSTAGGFIVDLENSVNTITNRIGDRATEVIGTEITKGNIPNYKFQGIQSPLPYVARFDKYGRYDKKGKYSIDTRKYVVIHIDHDKQNGFIYYDIVNNFQDGVGDIVAKMRFNTITKQFELTMPGMEFGNTPTEVFKVLTECYFGKTVYEFNYDYVMSMRLFDGASIAAGIVNGLLNINRPNPFKRGINIDNSGSDDGDSITNTDQVRIDAYVDKMVEKMIETDENEFTDCFYTFSNEDYESMEKEVADKIANNTLITDNGESPITEIYDIIGSYDADATLQEREETITTALLKAAEVCGYSDSAISSGNSSQTASPTDTYSYQTATGTNANVGNFIKAAVQYLVSCVVNALLTPKVMMLLQVNRMLMGSDAIPTNKQQLQDRYTFDIDDVLNGVSGILKGVIREIVDTIQKELLKMLLERLSEMMMGYLKKLGLEYAMKWVLLLKQLLACFKFNRNKLNGNNGRFGYGNGNGNSYGSSTSTISSIIDRVDYADIDALVDEIMPNTNPC